MTMMPFWRSKAARSIALQAGYVIALVAVIGFAVLTARANLAAQGLTSGFDFLWKSTGWEMNFTLLPADRTDPYWWFLLMGILNNNFVKNILRIVHTSIFQQLLFAYLHNLLNPF